MVESKDGGYILHSDAMAAFSDYLKFVLVHADDIENDVNDFGELKPMLEMVRGKGNS